jgi:transposase
LGELVDLLGPETAPARVGFEACREGWHVHDTLEQWGHQPLMLDTTRIKQIGVGLHDRKNDAIDAEQIAMAVDVGRVPLAHVLSPARRELRALLSVRSELVDTRARQVTTIRGLARASGLSLPTCATTNFLKHLEGAELATATERLVAPLAATLRTTEEQLASVDAAVTAMAATDPIIKLLASAPGVGVIVAATYVSVIDEAKRFRNARSVASYLGLVPSERTTGGNRRLGSITKRGNSYARKMLVQSAWQILRAAHVDDPLRRWGEQIATKRGRKVAAVALARRLAGVLWAMWRDSTVYDPVFAARVTATGLRVDAQKRELVANAMARVAGKLQRRARAAQRKNEEATT